MHTVSAPWCKSALTTSDLQEAQYQAEKVKYMDPEVKKNIHWMKVKDTAVSLCRQMDGGTGRLPSLQGLIMKPTYRESEYMYSVLDMLVSPKSMPAHTVW